jgi:hypothetical protein
LFIQSNAGKLYIGISSKQCSAVIISTARTEPYEKICQLFSAQWSMYLSKHQHLKLFISMVTKKSREVIALILIRTIRIITAYAEADCVLGTGNSLCSIISFRPHSSSME